MYAILAYAILNVLLFSGAAILSTCSNVHAILTNAIIGPALLSGHQTEDGFEVIWAHITHKQKT